MKKLKLLKDNELTVKIEDSIYCDFCGEADVLVVTSSYKDHNDESLNETQICFNCIK